MKSKKPKKVLVPLRMEEVALAEFQDLANRSGLDKAELFRMALGLGLPTLRKNLAPLIDARRNKGRGDPAGREGADEGQKPRPTAGGFMLNDAP